MQQTIKLPNIIAIKINNSIIIIESLNLNMNLYQIKILALKLNSKLKNKRGLLS